MPDQSPISPAILLDEVTRIARSGGEVLLKYFGKLTDSQVELKTSHRDLLTIADSEAEAKVIDLIRSRFAGHAILGEENGYIKGTEPYLWVIDPLDGTTNFAHSFPMFACSVGVLFKGQPVAGAVDAPYLRECFGAATGQGAYLNASRIKVSTTPDIKRSLLATGFSYNRNDVTRNNVDNFSKLILKAHDIRRAGAASLDLCYVAAGRFDGYWEGYLKPWDVAAGALVVLEAGGRVTDFDGHAGPDSWLWHEHLVASNALLHEELVGELSGKEAGYTGVFHGFAKNFK